MLETAACDRSIALPGRVARRPSMMRSASRSACAMLLLFAAGIRPAVSAVPGGTWLFDGRVALQTFDCGGLMCGRIVWLIRPDSAAGQPDRDTLNPDSALRQRPLCGLTIVWGMQPNGAGHWANGWLYDPKDGVTYDVDAELTAPNTLTARVYRGVPLLGRTEILVRDPPLSFNGRC
jgi:uncharacterized protein (DUF2147 family)